MGWAHCENDRREITIDIHIYSLGRGVINDLAL